jgi:23S rRNA (uracil1939-C5)-methyltransferase
MVQIRTEKLVFGGQALGYYNDKPIFLWNALPGELVEADITKFRKGIYEGIATNIIEKSEQRIDCQEDHYLSCSPWQIMTYEAENIYKQNICAEVFKNIPDLPVMNYSFPSERFGYRNKMEYSLLVEDKKVSLALSQRQGHSLINCRHCLLPDETLQATASAIETWLNNGVLTKRILKSLLVRTNGQGEAMAGLFVKDRVSFLKPEINFAPLKSWSIYYSTYKSPASVITDTLYQPSDNNYLTALINNKKFAFGIQSFMQNNFSMFVETLSEINKWLEIDNEVLDLFSGVGTIGISLADKCKKVTLVEISEEADYYAQQNIKLNNLQSKVESFCAPAEKILDLIKSEQTVVVDPPRAGLHKKLTEKLIEVAPKKIIYLSCNPSTQARDLTDLMLKYRVVVWRVYNYFPATPHIESLIVLERK